MNGRNISKSWDKRCNFDSLLTGTWIPWLRHLEHFGFRELVDWTKPLRGQTSRQSLFIIELLADEVINGSMISWRWFLGSDCTDWGDAIAITSEVGVRWWSRPSTFNFIRLSYSCVGVLNPSLVLSQKIVLWVSGLQFRVDSRTECIFSKISDQKRTGLISVPLKYSNKLKQFHK